MTFEEWADKVTDGMIRETFKAVKEREGAAAGSAEDTLCLFLAKYVGNVVHKTLSQQVPGDRQQQYERKHQQYIEVKTKVLEAVAAGFTAAMKNYSGKHLDYYCRLEDVTTPVNKEPC